MDHVVELLQRAIANSEHAPCPALVCDFNHKTKRIRQLFFQRSDIGILARLCGRLRLVRRLGVVLPKLFNLTNVQSLLDDLTRELLRSACLH